MENKKKNDQIDEDDRDGRAHSYFMHPDKPGKILCIPMADVDGSDMVCYFAQFMPEKDKLDTWNVSFPDLPGCLSCGTGLKQAMANSIDALGGYISVASANGIAIVEPSDMETAIAKAQAENEEEDFDPAHPPLYFLVPAWPDI